MKVIGLTGGIGSGKSTVSGFLAELGAVIIDADKVTHEALKHGTEIWRDVVDYFGQDILATTGEVDRQKLGKIVFDNPEALARLNRIMHPRMYNMVKARLDEYRRQGADVVVLEVILLIEAGWTSLADELWVTVAPENAVIERLIQQRNLTEEEIRARIEAQMPPEERAKHADVIINNDGDLNTLKDRVKELWENIHV